MRSASAASPPAWCSHVSSARAVSGCSRRAALLLAGILIAILAANTRWIPALITIAAFSLAITTTIIVGITYRQLAAPDDLRSSVNVIGRMIAWGGQPFGAATGAAIAAATDVPTAYVVAAAVMLISGIGAAVALRAAPSYTSTVAMQLSRSKNRPTHNRGGPMHIPDGFINGGTSLAAGVVAVGGTAVCLDQASKTLDDRQIPMVGLSAAFIFAAQMLNFPVASGTSGHLLGGVLAAVLVGPWAGAICVTVVLFVQALLFADGGLSALGLNVVNMALVGSFVGYGIFLAVRRLMPAKRSSVVVASGIAAGLAPVLAAVFFTLEYAIGGNGAASVGNVAAAMIGVHLLIGIGEGVITAMTVSAVLASRPDLVYGARDIQLTTAPVAVTVDGVRS